MWPRPRIVSIWLCNRCARLFGDDRADVDRKLARIADLELGHRALQHGERSVRYIVLQAEDAQSRTALAGRIEGRREHVDHDLLGERRGIDHHRVEAAGLADQRQRRAAAREAPGERLFDSARDRRRAGEDDALDAWIGDQRRADLARAGHELERVARNASLVHDAHGFRGDERRLLSGLGDHRIARRQRRRDLAGEDGERKIPGRDADDEAERGRGARQKRARGLMRIIAQEVGRLAHLRNRVSIGLARLAHDEADERVVARFENIGRAAQHRRPLGRRDRRERGRRAIAGLKRRGDFVGARVTDEADDVGPVGGIADRLARLVRRGARRKGAPRRFGACVEAIGEPGQASFVGEIHSARVDALRRIKVARRRYLVVRRPERLNRARDCDGVGDEIIDGEARIGDAVDERSVGAVLEQAADQIGEQRLVRARPARRPGMAG